MRVTPHLFRNSQGSQQTRLASDRRVRRMGLEFSFHPMRVTQATSRSKVADYFPALNCSQPLIHRRTDVLADEANTAIHHQEVRTADVPTEERVVVRPKREILFPIIRCQGRSVQRNTARRGRAIEPVPPRMVRPSRDRFADREGIAGSVGYVSDPAILGIVVRATDQTISTVKSVTVAREPARRLNTRPATSPRDRDIDTPDTCYGTGEIPVASGAGLVVVDGSDGVPCRIASVWQ